MIAIVQIIVGLYLIGFSVTMFAGMRWAVIDREWEIEDYVVCILWPAVWALWARNVIEDMRK